MSRSAAAARLLAMHPARPSFLPLAVVAVLGLLQAGCFTSFVALQSADGGTSDAQPGDAAIDAPVDAPIDGSVQRPDDYELCRVLGLGNVRDVAVSADGARIAIAADHEAVRVVAADDPGRELQHLLGHPPDGPFRVRFLSDGALASVASDGIRIFRPDGSLERMIPFPSARDLDEGPPGWGLAVLVGGQFVRLARDGTEIERISTGAYQGHVMHASPDRSRLMIAGANGYRVFELDGTYVTGYVLANVDRPAAAWSPDGTLVALSQVNGTMPDRPSVMIYSLVPADGAIYATGGLHRAHGLAFTADGRRLITARTGGIDVFAVAPPVAGDTVPEAAALEVAFTQDVEARAVAIAGTRAVIGSDGGTLTTLALGASVLVERELVHHVDPLRGVGFERDFVLTGDGRWATSTGTTMHVPEPGLRSIAARLDTTAVARSAEELVSVQELDGRPLAGLIGVRGETRMSFSPDGGSLVVLAETASGTGREVIFLDVVSDTELARYAVGDSGGNLTAVALSDDAAHVAYGVGPFGVEVRRRDGFLVLDVNDGTAGTPGAVAFSRDGREVAIALTDRATRIMTLDGSGERALEGTLPGPHAVAFSPEGDRVIQTSPDRALLHDAATGATITELGPEPASALGLVPAIAPLGERIVLAGDGTARLYCAR